MKDGYRNECKSCIKEQSDSRYTENKKNAEWVEVRREYARLNYYKSGRKKKSNSSDLNKWREKYPNKWPAIREANAKNKSIPGYQQHHWSYQKEDRTDTIYLTHQRHLFLHRHLAYDKDQMRYRVKLTGELLSSRKAHEKFNDSLNNRFLAYQRKIEDIKSRRSFLTAERHKQANMSFEITGTLIQRGQTETKGESFKVREFAIKTMNGQYENFVKFQCTQDRTSIVDGLNKGDEIKVHFDLRGRMYGDDSKIFTNLNAWRVESVSANAPKPAPANDAPADLPKAAPEPVAEESDSLPF